MKNIWTLQGKEVKNNKFHDFFLFSFFLPSTLGEPLSFSRDGVAI